MPNLLAIALDLHIDIALSIPALTAGAVHRASSSSKVPVSAGISIARMIRQLGHQAEIGSFVAGFNGRFAVHQFEAEALQGHYVWCEGDTGSHIQIDGADNRTTELHGQEMRIGAEQIAQFADLIRQTRVRFEWVSFSGVALPDLSASAYTTLLEAARPSKIAVNTHGAALAVFAHQSPDLLYLNADEASTLIDYQIDSLDTARRACLDLHRWGSNIIVIALGTGSVVGYDGQICLHVNVESDIQNSLTPLSTKWRGDGGEENNAHFAGILTALMEAQPLSVVLRQGVTASIAVQSTGSLSFDTLQALSTQIKVDSIN